MSRRPAGIGDLTDHWRRAAPGRPALRHGDRSWTWAQLADRVSRAAAAQRASGLRPGDRVALLDRASPEHLVLALACLRAGTVLVPVNARLADEQARYLISDSGARLLIAGEQFGPVAAAARELAPVRSVIMAGAQYEQWLAACQPPPQFPQAADDGCFLQVYTSGTTGFPKGAMFTAASATAQAAALAAAIGVSSSSVCLSGLPVFHIGSLMWGLTGLLAGGCCVITAGAGPRALLDEIETRQVTHVLVATAMLGALLDVPGVADRDLSHLQVLGYGASPVQPWLLQRCLQTLPVPLVQGYGATEACMTISLLHDAEHRDTTRPGRLASVGRPLAGVEVAIADLATGEPLGSGQPGEVRVRSAQVMTGYWAAGGTDTSAITPDGWLRTGDCGYVDDDGYLYLTGRLKDMYIHGGSNVYAAVVERVLTSHPDVAEAAVIGLPDDTWGESGLAFVIPAAGAVIDEAAVLAHCREHLAEFECPAGLAVMPEFPRNALGKVAKDELREQASGGGGPAVAR